ncbi:beta-galactosidase [Levilactobacillus fujinensis]|uniref:beta-galactosidase n=1 Tax=Levilactobacillus fujinensis TaxID=2486024 RepID=A0ABW1THD6_9LACO|nr:beta-galactosidase [Levilactobacillus fujinensis]
MSNQKHILFGAAYYHEYQPTPRLDEDFKMLHAAHMNVIRVGEGSWSHWEPEDGEFSLDWLQPVLDKAQANGIAVIIGMPTFAIPQWLVRKYPEVALHDEAGNAHNFGSREEHSLSHPVFQFYARRVIKKIVERYATHPAVIGWQLHNEPGLFINYSHDAFEGFKDYLRHKYQTVEKLNQEWGLVYWSHELSTWDDLWKPEGNAQPQYDIEWRRYQASLTDNLLHWQRQLIKSIAPNNQFITVNLALGRDALDEELSGKQLDVAATDLYYHMQNGMRLPNPEVPGKPWFTTGPSQIALQADRSYAVKQQPYYVAETDGGPIGGAGDNYPGFHGQWRQSAWQFIARGAEMIEYWQWQQLHFGTETYWGSVIPHDRKPGRVYHELAALGKELETAGATVTDLKPDADVAILYSVESRWGMSFEPYTSEHATSDPHKVRNPEAFDHMLSAFYEGAFISGRQVNLVHDSQLVNLADGTVLQDPAKFAAKTPILLAVGVYISSNGLLDWLQQYVAAGGHLVLGPRSTYADSLARARMETKPAKLVAEAGASYQEFSNLQGTVPVIGTAAMPMREGSAATEWIDCLEEQGAHTLATSDDPHFNQFPLITTNQSGKGQVTMVGTVPNQELAASIYDYLLPKEKWVTGHETVTHSSAVNGDGERLHFLFNWNWKPVSVDLPVACTPLNASEPIHKVDLGPWDVVVLKENK